MHSPLTGETYTAMPDGTCEIRDLHGNVGRVRLSADGTSFTVVSGEVASAAPYLIRWALAETETSETGRAS